MSLGLSEKLSIRDAIAHLLAKNLDTLPLSFLELFPIKEEFYNKPYLGVGDFVLSALKRAFSAPKI